MIREIKAIFVKQLLRVPLLYSWNIKRRFKVERQLIQGVHQAKSTHRSVIHFSINKAATTYTTNILSRCARENGIVPVRMNAFAFHSKLPFLDHLLPEEMMRYQHIFKSSGYLYTAFGGMVEGIPNLDEFLMVLMVRDPRDILTSDYFSIAYSHKPPRIGNKVETFMKRRAYAQRVDIDQFVTRESERIRRNFQRYLDLLVKRPNLYITTYEEMIADFEGWLNDLLDYCQLKISMQLKRELLEESCKSRPTKENIFHHIRQVTPGDHKRKLKPETITHLNSVFSNILREFNYR